MRNMALLLLLLVVLMFPTFTLAQQKINVGWVEKVKLKPGDVVIQAKMDTGADYSSLNASNIVEIFKEGKKWVRFDVLSRYGQQVTLLRELVRIAHVKQIGGKTHKRKVVLLGICVGNKYLEADVSLIDRSRFKYHMLVGRNFLAGNAIVDASSSFTSEPDCGALQEEAKTASDKVTKKP